MNRRERRADARKRMKLLKGGKIDLPPAPPPRDLSTPIARLAHCVDGQIRAFCVAEPTIQQTDVLVTLLRLAAALTVEMDQPSDEVAQAFEVFCDQEREARSGKPAS